MPTIAIFRSIRFLIFTRDHSPAHVHVEQAGRTCQVSLETFRAAKIEGFKPKEVYVITAYVKKNQERFLAAWEAIHGEE